MASHGDLGEYFIYALPFAFVGALSYAATRPLYSGPLPVPGINQVVVSPRYISHSIECIHPAGVSLEFSLSDGGTIRVRDFNANFQIDKEDTVEGALGKNLSLPDLLTATKRVLPKPKNPASFPLL